MSDTDQPQPPEQQPDGPRIGVDEWVARADERTGVRGGRFAPLFARAERLPNRFCAAESRDIETPLARAHGAAVWEVAWQGDPATTARIGWKV